MNSFILSSFLAVTAGFIGITYRALAGNKKWPIGNLFQRRSSIILIISGITIISGALEIFHQTKFLTGFFILIGTYISAFIITMISKHHAQIVFFILLIVSAIIWILGGSVIGTVDELNRIPVN